MKLSSIATIKTAIPPSDMMLLTATSCLLWDHHRNLGLIIGYPYNQLMNKAES